LKAQVIRKTPAPMTTAPAKAASTSCWETEVRLMDPFWTPHHRPAPPMIRPQTGVDGPLLDPAEEGGHL